MVALLRAELIKAQERAAPPASTRPAPCATSRPLPAGPDYEFPEEAIFAVLTDDELQSLFTAEERAAIRAHAPAFLVRPR